jgi:hypothetical protein
MKKSNNTPEQPQHLFYFPSSLFILSNPSFLTTCKEVANEYLKITKKKSPSPDGVYQTDNIFNDPRLSEFCQYVSQTAWNILDSQGVEMLPYRTIPTEMWVQEYQKNSSMPQHVHGSNSHIIGFYFLDCPKDCSRFILHDPRPGKVQTTLPEVDSTIATFTSNMINHVPEPGTMMFANSWLPHSFSRNLSSKPLKLIHFSIGIDTAIVNPTEKDAPEIV